MLLCGVSAVSAATVDFDDIDASFGDVVLDSLGPYQGFTWTNFSAYTIVPGFPGFNNGIVSPDNAAYSGGELFGPAVTPIIGKIAADDPFDFVSAYLGSGYYDNLSLTVQGKLDGSVLFTRSVILDTTTPILVNFSFTSIDELNFFAGTTPATTDPFACGTVNCTQFTLDNLTFAPASSTPPPDPDPDPEPNPVPEPSTPALIGLAGMVAAAIRRRTMKA